MHLGPPGLPSSRSASTPSFPPPGSGKVAVSGLQNPDPGPSSGRRSGTAMSNDESWDEGDYDIRGEDGGDQPWGMPQDQYKALNPTAKKQVRNRIGARRFRAKRKDYVAALERQASQAREQLNRCHSQIQAYRDEINTLRARLGADPLPEIDLSQANALGLRRSPQS
ncbi:hypothetical protein TREMEDRAFT_63494 [Tremella mesenterica DSM 1558]|nr:uncharacterized protein TREMEDRAFT_63494 [Tremella mesenterica DSM 1558]EIW68321.1 hypothetical protein TREMEDRAFT_63494 [Tremella mesenterica DSM 1558]